MLPVSKRETRTLLTGASIAVAGLLIAGIVVPARRSYATSVAALEQERALRRREETLVDSRPKISFGVQSLHDSLNGARERVVDASTTTTAAMRLASHLREMALDVDMHGVRLTDVGSDSMVGSLRRVRVQIEVQTAFAQAAELLNSIERDTLSMNVLEFEMVSSGAAGSVNAGKNATSALRLRAIVTALARIESPSTSARR